MFESSIEKKCCAYAKSKNVHNRKLVTLIGDPDRIFLYNGFCCFIEFKKAGSTPRIIQLHRINELSKQGFLATYVDSLEEFQFIIDRWVALCDKKLISKE